MATNGRMTLSSGKTTLYLRTWTNGYVQDAIRELIRIPHRLVANAVKLYHEDEREELEVYDRTPACWFVSVAVRRDTHGITTTLEDVLYHYRSAVPVEDDVYSVANWFCQGWFNSWHVVESKERMEECDSDCVISAKYGRDGVLTVEVPYDPKTMTAADKSIRQITPPGKELGIGIQMEKAKRSMTLVIPIREMIRMQMCEAVIKILKEKGEA